MTPKRWQVIKDIFDRATLQRESSRAAFVERECAGDSVLRGEVAALLASDAAAAGFIEEPAALPTSELRGSGVDGAMPTTGSVVAHYRIVARLGAGGMGRVYLAEDTRLGRKVALKVLAPEWVGSTVAQARFAREARLASALDHPNICTIFDVGQAAGVSFIAMQYLQGATLEDVLRRGPLAVEPLLAIAEQVAEALGAAHAQGIVHRDVKPSNVMVTERRAHVLDFGIATLIERNDQASTTGDGTLSGLIIGTPSYLSPEQARGAPVDHRTDIFSFGAVLYEMATGRVPFRGRTNADTMAALLTQPHMSACVVNPEVPESLGAVVDRALAKDPDERYQAMIDIRSALQQVRASASMPHAALRREEAPAQPGGGGRASSDRLTRRGIGIALALVLATVTLLARLPAVMRGNSAINTIAVLPFATEPDARELEYLGDGIADSVIARLSELPATTVIARSTSSVYKDAVDPRTAGRDLRVRAVLTGKVVREAETIVVRVELVDVNTGARLWGRAYRRSDAELAQVPSEVAVAVARELRAPVTGQQARRLARDDTRSPDAYQQYLKGRFFWNKRTADGYTKAIGHFTAAINADPTFALAYTGLADSYSVLRSYGMRSAEEVIPLARAAAERALQIDPSLAEAHASLGKIAMDTYRWADADAAFRRAIELNPSYALAHHWQAMNLAEVGRLEDALQAIRQARALDPLSLIINTEVGRLLYFSRDYAAAIAQFAATIEMDPSFGLAHLHLGSVFLEQGRCDEAGSEFAKAATVGGPMPAVSLARAHARAGGRREAEAALRRLLVESRQRFIPPYAFALLYLSLGDQERAIDWIERGLSKPGNGPWFLKANPAFDSIRPNPRYRALLQKMGLST